MELELSTNERLRKQEKLLERIYRANYEVDPHSQATRTSRSNLIAVQHTAKQMYEVALSQEVPIVVGALEREK
jgi:hypothetical protein